MPFELNIPSTNVIASKVFGSYAKKRAASNDAKTAQQDAATAATVAAINASGGNKQLVDNTKFYIIGFVAFIAIVVIVMIIIKKSK